MYCKECGKKIVPSFSVPAKCPNCKNEFHLQPQWLVNILPLVCIPIMVIVALLFKLWGWDMLVAFVVGLALSVVVYARGGVALFNAGILHSDQLVEELPAAMRKINPQKMASRQIDPLVQMRLNLSQVELPENYAAHDPRAAQVAKALQVEEEKKEALRNAEVPANHTASHAKHHATAAQGHELHSSAVPEHALSHTSAPHVARHARHMAAAPGAGQSNELHKGDTVEFEALPNEVVQNPAEPHHPHRFERLQPSDQAGVRAMSQLASGIVREHFDPIIGPNQNSYMIERFNSVHAIEEQLLHEGYRYYFVCNPDPIDAELDGPYVGFLAYYFDEPGDLYLSKFYLKKEYRGKDLSRTMLNFLCKKAREKGCNRITLNVNRNNYQAILAYEHLGFVRIDERKQDIGHGFVMDDAIYQLQL